MISPRNLVLTVLVCLLALTDTACLRQARARRNRAEADRAEAQADLARAQAEAIRTGEGGAEGEYVESESEPKPPAAVEEAVLPAPTSLHVWVAGCHHWRHGGWVWVPGRWVLPPRRGAVWVGPHWRRRGRGWVWIGGGWR